MLSFLLADIRNIVIAALLAALAAAFFAWKIERSDFVQAKVSIEVMKMEAERYENDSKRIANELSTAIPRVVEQAQKDALANYKARYPLAGNAACGIRADGLRLRPGSGDGQADVPERVDAAEPTGISLTADFLDRAAKAAVMIAGCQKFAIDNKLDIK